MIPLKNQAIQTALLGNWEDAILLNKQLLKESPEDIETLNRLGFAYIALGKDKDAKSMYKKVLKLDSQNQIAMKNLKKLKSHNGVSHSVVGNPTAFLEETGKTKIIELINLTQPKTIAHLRSGESILLAIKRSKIFALDCQKTFIGMLPDNIGKRLIKFIKGGNQYEAFIKSVDAHKVVLFIREVKRSSRFKNQPSFLTTTEKSQFFVSADRPKKSPDNHVDSEDSEEGL